MPTSIIAQQVVRCYNDVYGSDKLSAYEMVKEFSLAISSSASPICYELIIAQKQLQAKRKLNLILPTKSQTIIYALRGDIVVVYVKTGKNKLGCWLSYQQV